jgi:hypothetical protein
VGSIYRLRQQDKRYTENSLGGHPTWQSKNLRGLNRT